MIAAKFLTVSLLLWQCSPCNCEYGCVAVFFQVLQTHVHHLVVCEIQNPEVDIVLVGIPWVQSAEENMLLLLFDFSCRPIEHSTLSKMHRFSAQL